MKYLFSYGSNNPQQLAKRLNKIIDLDKVIPVYYPRHKLSFGYFSKKWNGGVATILSSNTTKDKVYGYIIPLTKEDFLILDRFEGVHNNIYKQKTVNVISKDGKEYEAIAYILTSKYSRHPTKPSDSYLSAIQKTHKIYKDY